MNMVLFYEFGTPKIKAKGCARPRAKSAPGFFVFVLLHPYLSQDPGREKVLDMLVE